MSNREQGISKWKGRLIVIAIALLPFILIELGLRWVGYGRPSPTDISLAAPLFAVDGDMIRVSPQWEGKLRARPFMAKKPENTVRVFAVGDSVTYGWTYSRSVIRAMPDPYPALLQKMLNNKYRGRPSYEVINCGIVKCASRRLSAAVREILKLEPDMIIYMAGNDEYLENEALVEASSLGVLRHIRIVKLLRDMIARDVLSMAGKSSPWLPVRFPGDTEVEYPRARGTSNAEARKRILSTANSNLLDMAESCSKAGVPLLFCTMPSNLRFPASVPGSPRSYPPEVAQAISAIIRGDGPEAIGLLDKAMSNMPENDPARALPCYLKGRAYDMMEDYVKAKEWYVIARDIEPLPLRTTSQVNDIPRKLATVPGTVLVDVEKVFAEAAPNGIPGFDFFYDNCHPIPQGHRLIAETLLPIVESIHH